MACCDSVSVGYSSPQEAMKAEKEKVLLVPCIATQAEQSDYLAVIDADPASPTYAQVINRVSTGRSGVELHHSGWNSCSSCYGKPGSPQRRFLVLPALVGGNIFVFDCADPRNPKLHVVVEREKILSKTGLSYLHSAHCLGTGEILVSAMGTGTGERSGGFLLLDQDFEVKGRWESQDSKVPSFGYDMWYQPRVNIMVSSEWGEPNAFVPGFNPEHVKNGRYGHHLHFWDFKERKHLFEIDLGLAEGALPLEVRMLHEPTSTHGFVGVALSSNVIHFWKGDNGKLPISAYVMFTATLLFLFSVV